MGETTGWTAYWMRTSRGVRSLGVLSLNLHSCMSDSEATREKSTTNHLCPHPPPHPHPPMNHSYHHPTSVPTNHNTLSTSLVWDRTPRCIYSRLFPPEPIYRTRAHSPAYSIYLSFIRFRNPILYICAATLVGPLSFIFIDSNPRRTSASSKSLLPSALL